MSDENTVVFTLELEASASVACAHGESSPHDDCPGPGIEPPEEEQP